MKEETSRLRDLLSCQEKAEAVVTSRKDLEESIAKRSALNLGKKIRLFEERTKSEAKSREKDQKRENVGVYLKRRSKEEDRAGIQQILGVESRT